jgi:hypothetical protein
MYRDIDRKDLRYMVRYSKNNPQTYSKRDRDEILYEYNRRREMESSIKNRMMQNQRPINTALKIRVPTFKFRW